MVATKRARAERHHGPQEGELGFGELGGGVGDEHDRVGERQRGDGGRAVHRAEPADAGRVDQRQAPFEERRRQADLDEGEVLLVAPVPGLGDGVGEVVDRDAPAHRLGAELGPGHGGGRQLWGPLHDRRDGGRHVVVDGTDLEAEHGVDERALPLLELPDDEHPDARGSSSRVRAVRRRSTRSGRS